MRARYDVVVIGAGPTGLALTLFLLASGVDAVVVERASETVKEPRAVTLDDESLRAFATLGLAEALEPMLLTGYGTRWLTGAGTPFARVGATASRYGFACRNGFSQPEFVAFLAATVRAREPGALAFDTSATAVTHTPDGMRVDVQCGGEERSMTAAYVVDCEGANSRVRERAGVALAGSTYDAPWLIVDTVNSRDDARYSRFYCGSPRPTVCVPGRGGRMRYEFMLHPGEDPEAMKDPAVVRELLAGKRELADPDVVRIAIYRFHSKVAERFRSGRLFFAGDAAHLMPPFAGQGLNAGIRDAFNLAWKLALVVQGIAGDALLDTYEAERAPHVRAMLRLSQAIGYVVMSRSRRAALLRGVVLRGSSKIPGLREYVAGMRFKPENKFRRGFVVRGRFDVRLTGRLVPNPLLLAADERYRRLDDIAGPGFFLLTMTEPGEGAPAVDASALWNALGVRRVHVLAGERTPAPRPRALVGADVAGDLARALGRSRGATLLVRPDRIVAGVFRAEDEAEFARELSAAFALRASTADCEQPPQNGGARDADPDIGEARKRADTQLASRDG